MLAVIDGNVSTAILGLGGDKFRWVRAGYWSTRWSLDGRSLYLDAAGASASAPARTLAIALNSSAPLDIPPEGTTSGTYVLPHGTGGLPGPNPDTYAFTHTEWLRNIFRIPLHR